MTLYIDIGTPKRIRISLSEFRKRVEEYKSARAKYDLYCSLPYTERQIRLDYLFFDMDGKRGSPHDSAIALHEYLMEKKIKHAVLFSGRGFHVIVYCKKTYVNKSDKNKVFNLQKFMLDAAGAFDYDSAVLGDLRRLRRIPNTYNTRGNLFCIYLTERDLYSSLDDIKLIARVPARIHKFDGELYQLDMTKKQQDSFNSLINKEDEEYHVPYMSKIKEVPICIRAIISRKTFVHYPRFLLITYIDSVRGKSKSETIIVLSKILPKNKFDHMMNDENQVDYVFGNYTFPSCEIIKDKGCCPIKGLCKFAVLREIAKEV